MLHWRLSGGGLVSAEQVLAKYSLWILPWSICTCRAFADLCLRRHQILDPRLSPERAKFPYFASNKPAAGFSVISTSA